MSLTLPDLAALVGCASPPDASDQQFTGVASLDQAKSNEISFLGNPRYLPQLQTTRAGAVIVPRSELTPPDGVFLLPVDNPSLAFAAIVDHFQKKQSTFIPGIHPGAHVAADVQLNPEKVSVKAGAVIESGARIGDGSEIGSGAYISHNVQIGNDCVIHANVSIRERCEIGARVILQPGAVIGSDGYGYEFADGKHVKIPQVGIVVLEDDVEIGANSCIDRARFGETRIGKGTKIDNLVQIGHNASIGDHCLIVSQTGIAGSAKLGNNVTVAAQCGISGHLQVGDSIILAGRAGVTKNLTEPGVYYGMPARPMAKEQRRLASINLLPKLLKRLKKLEAKFNQNS